MFGDTVRNIFGVLPFLQLTVLSRQSFLARIEKVTSLPADILTGEIARDFGIELWLGDRIISPAIITAMLAATTVMLLIVLMFTFSRLRKTE
jgi:hypothetical protein